jgi:hypothetical protein
MFREKAGISVCFAREVLNQSVGCLVLILHAKWTGQKAWSSKWRVRGVVGCVSKLVEPVGVHEASASHAARRLSLSWHDLLWYELKSQHDQRVIITALLLVSDALWSEVILASVAHNYNFDSDKTNREAIARKTHR